MAYSKTSWSAAAGSLAVGLGLLILPAAVFAQDDPEVLSASPDAGDDDTDEDEKAASGASSEATIQGERMESIVRGFYLEGKIGGGYMLLNQPVRPDRFNPNATGDEGLGVGGSVHMAVGYDITDLIAVQIFGGALMADSRRLDVVRDMAMVYGGLGARIALDITERLDYLVQAGGMFVSADNAVDAPEQGFGVLASTGIEYYVHVRHFSVGLDVAVYLPVQPVRLFISGGPFLKYTF